jgi:hypothetical protein
MAEKIHVSSPYLKAKFGHGIDQGYTALPNIILDHAAELGISDKALLFIVHVLRLQDRKRQRPDHERLIRDDEIPMQSAAATLKRIRAELRGLVVDGTPLVGIKSFYHQDGAGHVAGSGTFYDFRPLINHILAKYYSEPIDQNEPSAGEPVDQNDTPGAQNVTPEDQKGAPWDQIDPYNSEHKNNKTIECSDEYILYERDGWQFRRDRTIKYLPDDEVFAIRELRKIFHPSHSVLQDTIRLYGIDDL